MNFVSSPSAFVRLVIEASEPFSQPPFLGYVPQEMAPGLVEQV